MCGAADRWLNLDSENLSLIPKFPPHDLGSWTHNTTCLGLSFLIWKRKELDETLMVWLWLYLAWAPSVLLTWATCSSALRAALGHTEALAVQAADHVEHQSATVEEGQEREVWEEEAPEISPNRRAIPCPALHLGLKLQNSLEVRRRRIPGLLAHVQTPGSSVVPQ